MQKTAKPFHPLLSAYVSLCESVCVCFLVLLKGRYVRISQQIPNVKIVCLSLELQQCLRCNTRYVSGNKQYKILFQLCGVFHIRLITEIQ